MRSVFASKTIMHFLFVIFFGSALAPTSASWPAGAAAYALCRRQRCQVRRKDGWGVSHGDTMVRVFLY